MVAKTLQVHYRNIWKDWDPMEKFGSLEKMASLVP